MQRPPSVDRDVDSRILAAVVLPEGATAPIATRGSSADVDRLLATLGDNIVEIDLRDATDKPITVRLLLRGADDATGPDASARHILIIDDEAHNRTYYEEVLASGGYDVRLAATGYDGYKEARRHKPALILLDVRLPDTNGYEVARLIRSEASLDDVPILLMSSDPELAVDSRIASAGAAGFIVAPIAPEQLLRVVGQTRPSSAASGPPLAVTDRSEATGVTATLFGPPALSGPHRRIAVPPGRSAELFATLAISAPNPVQTERLASLGWSEGNPASSGAVYTAMSRLRTHLARRGFDQVLESDAAGYRLSIKPDDIDVLVFDKRATDALRLDNASSTNAAELTEILGLWTAPPFTSRVDNELIARFAVRLHETSARLLETLAVCYLDDGEHNAATVALTNLLAEEPWRENAWALLITALYRAGRQRNALEAFQEARSRMANELGVDPGPRLKSCELMILQHDPTLMTPQWVRAHRVARASAKVPLKDGGDNPSGAVLLDIRLATWRGGTSSGRQESKQYRRSCIEQDAL
ncbi:MAG: BTAD domain-containing putative transcriptional regulator [Acidimicrobiales bacterium]